MSALDQFLKLLRPLYLIALSLSFIPSTVVVLLLSLQLGKLASWKSFQHAWFGRFWTYFGPLSRESAEATVAPLLRNAKGVVLDIGPGSGQWLRYFSPSKNGLIKHIYGVEPNQEHHAALRTAIKEAGLTDIYEILGVGVEELQSCGIVPGSIDTIATVQVLCSVPRPEAIVKELYPYLRPGGEWLVYEHIKTRYTYELVSWWQRIVDHAWPLCFDGCSITRPTDEFLLQAGAWEEFDLKAGADENQFDTIPHAIGVLVKRR